jgi:hypothetical protein
MSSDWYFTEKECLLVANREVSFQPFSHQSIDSKEKYKELLEDSFVNCFIALCRSPDRMSGTAI